MLTLRFSVGLSCGLFAAACALWACSTETTITSAPPSADDGGTAPTDDGGPADDAASDGVAPPARSVKGTWEKVAVHPPDGDPIGELGSIIVRSGTDVYASEGASNLGTGYYHYDGKGWTGVRYPGYSPNLVALPSGEVLGVGSQLAVKAKTGVEWELLPQPQGPGSPALLYSLWGSSIANLYASGNSGNVHFNGSTWSQITGLDTHSGSFFGLAEKDIWFTAGKNSQLWHYDGTTWTQRWTTLPETVTKYPQEGPYNLFGSAGDDVWGMGRARTLVHYDGAAWSVIPGPQDEWGCDLTRGWASSKRNAWLGGTGGCLFHWDGTAWEKLPSGVTETIYSIHGADPEHVWIASASKTTVLRLKPE